MGILGNKETVTTTSNAITVKPTTVLDTGGIGDGLKAQADAQKETSGLVANSITEAVTKLETIENKKGLFAENLTNIISKNLIFIVVLLMIFGGKKQ